MGFQFCRRMVNRICATEQKILVLEKYLLYLTLKSIQAFKQTTAANIFVLTAKQTNLNVSISVSSTTALSMAKKLFCCVIYPISMAFCFEHFLLSTNLFACASLGYGFTSSIRLISILSYNIEVFLLLKIYLYRTRRYQ